MGNVLGVNVMRLQNRQTFPSMVLKNRTLEMVISSLCPRIKLKYKKTVKNLGMNTYRFVLLTTDDSQAN